VKAVLLGSLLRSTMRGRLSFLASVAVMGAHKIPLVFLKHNVIASGVTNSAAMMRSPVVAKLPKRQHKIITSANSNIKSDAMKSSY
jgi:hypothetical protein